MLQEKYHKEFLMEEMHRTEAITFITDRLLWSVKLDVVKAKWNSDNGG